MNNLEQLYLKKGFEVSEFLKFKKLPCLNYLIKNSSIEEVRSEIKYTQDESIISKIIKNGFMVSPIKVEKIIGSLDEYKFDFELYLDKERSYLISEDKTDKGASLDQKTVYLWEGGIDFYSENECCSESDILGNRKGSSDIGSIFDVGDVYILSSFFDFDFDFDLGL